MFSPKVVRNTGLSIQCCGPRIGVAAPHLICDRPTADDRRGNRAGVQARSSVSGQQSSWTSKDGMMRGCRSFGGSIGMARSSGREQSTNGNVAADQQPRQSRIRLLQSSVVYTMLAQTVSNERMCKTQCAVYADVRMQPLNIPPRASWCHYFTSAAVAAEAYLHLPQRQHSSALVQ
jgi:hypothetical protein